MPKGEPRRIDQTYFHDRAEDLPGNCWPACIAMLTGQLLEDVPHVTWEEVDEGWDSYWRRFTPWLLELGLVLLDIDYPSPHSIIHPPVPDSWYIATGPSPRTEDRNHCVVCAGDMLWHDPHPSRGGLVEHDVVSYLASVKPWIVAAERKRRGKGE